MGTFNIVGAGLTIGNIIELFDSIEEIPVNVRIFNSRGEQVSESQVSHGIYLYRYEQGPRVWTEKRFIP